MRLCNILLSLIELRMVLMWLRMNLLCLVWMGLYNMLLPMGWMVL